MDNSPCDYVYRTENNLICISSLRWMETTSYTKVRSITGSVHVAIIWNMSGEDALHMFCDFS